MSRSRVYVILTPLPTNHKLIVVEKTTTNLFIEATRQWIESVIIKYNFCPFARPEMQNDSINYVLSDSSSIDMALDKIEAECQILDAQCEIATSLIILPQGFDNFERYLDLIDLLQSQIIDPTYEGIYQVASFHPLYCFADSEPSDAANYTNRSPYPAVHLIRESSITQALANFPDPQNIPVRNMALARRKGSKKMAELLDACRLTQQ